MRGEEVLALGVEARVPEAREGTGRARASPFRELHVEHGMEVAHLALSTRGNQQLHRVLAHRFEEAEALAALVELDEGLLDELREELDDFFLRDIAADDHGLRRVERPPARED